MAYQVGGVVVQFFDEISISAVVGRPIHVVVLA